MDGNCIGSGEQKSLELLQSKSPEQELQMTLLLRAVLSSFQSNT